MKTAADFNKELEEKKKKEEAANAGEKKPMMTKDESKYYCGNPGCKERTFVEESNGDESCNYHKGAAVFHDTVKYWTCCT